MPFSLELFLPFTFFLALFFEVNHFLVSLLKLQGLFLFSWFFGLLELVVEGLLSGLLGQDFVLEVWNFRLLDALETNGVIAGFFDFSHEFLFFLGKVMHASLHLLFVLFGLFVLLSCDAFRALDTFASDVKLLVARQSYTLVADANFGGWSDWQVLGRHCKVIWTSFMITCGLKICLLVLFDDRLAQDSSSNLTWLPQIRARSCDQT